MSDFGHSKLVASGEFNRNSSIQLTSRWSAPEMVQSDLEDLEFESVPTLASDVWSFGMVIMEVSKGRQRNGLADF